MIQIFTTEKCAYCPRVKQYLKINNVDFTEIEAYGEEHAKLVDEYGVSVPLTYNTVTKKGVTGINIAVLKEVIK